MKKCEDAFQGIYKRTAEVAKWTHKLTPRYVQHIVETDIAAMLDPDLKFDVVARPKMYEGDEWQTAQDSAKAMRILLDFQLDEDRFVEKQRDLVLQERVGGIAWTKVYWHKSERMRKKLAQRTGMFGLFPRLEETEEVETLFDGPCTQVVNNRDIVWDMGSIDVERCPLIAHRIYMTDTEIEAMGAAGIYQNTEQMKGARNQAMQEDGPDRRKQNRNEIWEMWRRESGGKTHVYTVGERRVELQSREHPYWHGQMPFVPFSSSKKPLQLSGWAQVELLKDLQESLWSVQNLTLDALMLSIMPIVLYSSDYDINDFDFSPYAQNEVDRPDQVVMWTPSNSQAQVGLPTIQMLKADMQNISGSQPFTSASDARNVGANTATEASLISSTAARSMSASKACKYRHDERVGQQFLELNQQLVRDDVYVKVVDLDEQAETQKIMPVVLQGELAFTMKPMSESLNRQERRAEATTRFQAMMQSAPVFAAMQAPLNPKAILQDFLDAFDAGPAEKYLSAAPQQLLTQPSAPSPDQAAGDGGVTNPALAAGPPAPSNAMSQSPEMMMQRAMAANGGQRSV